MNQAITLVGEPKAVIAHNVLILHGPLPIQMDSRVLDEAAPGAVVSPWFRHEWQPHGSRGHSESRTEVCATAC